MASHDIDTIERDGHLCRQASNVSCDRHLQLLVRDGGRGEGGRYPSTPVPILTDSTESEAQSSRHTYTIQAARGEGVRQSRPTTPEETVVPGFCTHPVVTSNGRPHE
eukprot:scaffold288766_cov33-Tisochrysis_lutea.AAC.7